MKPSPFFIIFLSFLFFSSFSQADVDSVGPVYTQSLENQIARPELTNEEHLAFYAEQTMEVMLLFYDEEDLIITATKQPQKLSDAPAIATVITANDIRRMGARDIVDVLQKVPGFHVTKGYYGKEAIEVRGIKTVITAGVLFLIDSRPCK